MRNERNNFVALYFKELTRKKRKTKKTRPWINLIWRKILVFGEKVLIEEETRRPQTCQFGDKTFRIRSKAFSKLNKTVRTSCLLRGFVFAIL